MFYEVEVEDYVRVEPSLFGLPTLEAVEKQLKEIYSSYYSRDLGKSVVVTNVSEVGEGVIIPGDGAVYYKSKFSLLVWKPELHELVFGSIAEITNFGAFIDMGVMKGMIHISQTMDDFVSFSKANSLSGKSSKRVLKQGDLCLARIVALSHKGGELKIGLTMRQPGLGKLDWIKEDAIKRQKEAEKAAKAEAKSEKKEKSSSFPKKSQTKEKGRKK